MTSLNDIPPEDAPPEMATLFHEWLASGHDWRFERPLVDMLRPRRGIWQLAGQWAFRLVKLSDRRDDVVMVRRRSMSLGRNRMENSEPREVVMR